MSRVATLFKRGWNEIPEVIASSFMGLVGLGIGAAALINYQNKDGDNRRYKMEYTVYRPDDPRVKKIKE